MPDPTTPSALALTTAASAAASVPTLTALGINLGLNPALLIAGMCGALVGIVLLNTVPASGDTWQALLRDSARRLFVIGAGALTAGYLTPAIAAPDPTPATLGAAFIIGAGAQQALQLLMRKRLALLDQHAQQASEEVRRD